MNRTPATLDGNSVMASQIATINGMHGIAIEMPDGSLRFLWVEMMSQREFQTIRLATQDEIKDVVWRFIGL